MSRLTHGFTLLELLVVLIIAGLLTALASPLISNATPGLRTRVAAYEILSDLREARNTAISKSRTVDIIFDLGRHRMSITGDQRELHDDVEYRILDASGQSQRTGRNRSQFRLQFFPDGSSSGMQLRMGDADHGYDVSVGWLMGRISVSEAREHAS
jgi:general secretion pathway protein H